VALHSRILGSRGNRAFFNQKIANPMILGNGTRLENELEVAA